MFDEDGRDVWNVYFGLYQRPFRVYMKLGQIWASASFDINLTSCISALPRIIVIQEAGHNLEQALLVLNPSLPWFHCSGTLTLLEIGTKSQPNSA